MTISQAQQAFQQHLEAWRWAVDHGNDHLADELAEDLVKAKTALEIAWLEQIAEAA